MSDEARSTLDRIVDKQQQFEDHAIEVLKIDLLVGSLVLTAASFLASVTGVPSASVPAYGTAGIGTLAWIGSIAMAELTYFGVSTRVGVHRDAVESVSERDVDPERMEELLVRTYAEAISFNSRETRSTAFRIAVALGLTTVSILAFVVTLLLLL